MRSILESGDEDDLTAASTPEFFTPFVSTGTVCGGNLNRVDSARKFADGEFLRFYLTGLCLRAAADGMQQLLVYSAPALDSIRAPSSKLG